MSREQFQAWEKAHDEGRTPLVPDAQMCEDIRLGVLVRTELAALGYWKKKDGSGPSFSFCATLLQMAGGVQRLLSEWDHGK